MFDDAVSPLSKWSGKNNQNFIFFPLAQQTKQAE